MAERKKRNGKSRRRFLHQMGMSVAGLVGLSRLTKAMTEEEEDLQILRCPRQTTFQRKNSRNIRPKILGISPTAKN